MTIATLDDLFLHTLKDALYAERKILRALPRMARRATAPGLRAALAAYQDATEEHIIRLETVFDLIGRPVRGAKCEAMVGLIDEADSLIANIDDAGTMDAALIASAQAVAHYEIARYGSLVAWAADLGKSDAAGMLKVTLKEECATDKALSRMAAERPVSMAVA